MVFWPNLICFHRITLSSRQKKSRREKHIFLCAQIHRVRFSPNLFCSGSTIRMVLHVKNVVINSSSGTLILSLSGKCGLLSLWNSSHVIHRWNLTPRTNRHAVCISKGRVLCASEPISIMLVYSSDSIQFIKNRTPAWALFEIRISSLSGSRQSAKEIMFHKWFCHK
jgi:hypothetical protein